LVATRKSKVQARLIILNGPQCELDLSFVAMQWLRRRREKKARKAVRSMIDWTYKQMEKIYL
jgi:hypothetical protein